MARSSGCIVSDTDACAFLASTGITDVTISNAVNDLVMDLKAASIWTKMTALYPFVGGDATKHSYNLKNPATFQITWHGTVTQNANGMTGNGTTGYGDTGLVGDTNTTLNDVHMSVYCRTVGGSSDNMYDLGAENGAGFAMLVSLKNQGANGPTIGMIYRDDISTSWVLKSDASAEGHWIFSRRGTTDFEGYKNGTSFQTQTNTNTGARPPRSFFIGAQNLAGTASNFSNRNLALVSIGTGLNDTEASDFYTAVQAFETAISRQV